MAAPKPVLIAGRKPQCPRCECTELRRQGRVGFMQRVVYTRLGFFPWECGLCRNIYMLKQRFAGVREFTLEPGSAARKLDLTGPLPVFGARFEKGRAS